MSTLSRVSPRYIGKKSDKVYEKLLSKNTKLTLPFQRFAIEQQNIPESEKFKPDELTKWRFLPGDTVLVTKGSRKGTITKVIGYNQGANGLYLEDGPTKDYIVPKQLWNQYSTSYVNTLPESVHPKDLKLIAKMDLDDSGVEKDVIIQDFTFDGTKYFDKNHQKLMPNRIVTHNNESLILTWPAPDTPVSKSAASNQDVNSERTYFVDSIIHNQIPNEALSTIRNPHSKYRKGIFTNKTLSKFVAPEMPSTYVPKSTDKKVLPANNLKNDALKDFIGGKIKEYIQNQKKQLGM